MPRAVIYLPSGEQKALGVGIDNVTNLFSDEKNGSLVVVTEKEVTVFTGLPYVLEKERKTKTENE